jgi:hypothetical protein
MQLMKRWKQLLFYLLLNILVSTITILAVLFIYENTRLKGSLILAPEGGSSSAPDTAGSNNTTPASPSGPSPVEIVDVTGVGNLPTERVRVQRVGGDPDQVVSLLNWRIRDENNNEFNISASSGLNSLNLHDQGAIDIYSKSGVSTPIELYLGADEPLWSSGEIVTLLDAGGNVRDTYLIP